MVGCIFGGLFTALKSGQTVNVSWSEKDLQSACKKTSLVFYENRSPGLDIVENADQKSTHLEATLSSAELTALANAAVEKYDCVNDLKIKLDSNSCMEMSFTLGDRLENLWYLIPKLSDYKDVFNMAKGAQIYMQTSIQYKSSNQFSVKVLSLSVGKLKIEGEKANQIVLAIFSQFTNEMNNNNIELSALSIEDDMLYYQAELK